jgi:hypothetical protein
MLSCFCLSASLSTALQDGETGVIVTSNRTYLYYSHLIRWTHLHLPCIVSAVVFKFQYLYFQKFINRWHVWNDLPLGGGGGSEQEEHGMILLVNSSVNLWVLWIRIRWSVTKWPPKIRIRNKKIRHSEPWNSDPDSESMPFIITFSSKKFLKFVYSNFKMSTVL